MSCSNSHTHPDHIHGPHCGHTAIRHEDHICYVHGGQLHQPHEDHYHDHVIEVTKANPDQCVPNHDCGNHVHGPNCGHEAIPHGDHIDYLVNGRLHHVHNGHCDDHGPIELVKE